MPGDSKRHGFTRVAVVRLSRAYEPGRRYPRSHPFLNLLGPGGNHNQTVSFGLSVASRCDDAPGRRPAPPGTFAAVLITHPTGPQVALTPGRRRDRRQRARSSVASDARLPGDSGSAAEQPPKTTRALTGLTRQQKGRHHHGQCRSPARVPGSWRPRDLHLTKGSGADLTLRRRTTSPPAITTTSSPRLGWPSSNSLKFVGSLLTVPTRFTSAQASRPARSQGIGVDVISLPVARGPRDVDQLAPAASRRHGRVSGTTADRQQPLGCR